MPLHTAVLGQAGEVPGQSTTFPAAHLAPAARGGTPSCREGSQTAVWLHRSPCHRAPWLLAGTEHGRAAGRSSALLSGGSGVIPWSASQHHCCSQLLRVGIAPERATSPSGCFFKQTQIMNVKPSAWQYRQPRQGGQISQSSQRHRLGRERQRAGTGPGKASRDSPRDVTQCHQGRAGSLVLCHPVPNAEAGAVRCRHMVSTRWGSGCHPARLAAAGSAREVTA